MLTRQLLGLKIQTVKFPHWNKSNWYTFFSKIWNRREKIVTAGFSILLSFSANITLKSNRFKTPITSVQLSFSFRVVLNWKVCLPKLAAIEIGVYKISCKRERTTKCWVVSQVASKTKTKATKFLLLWALWQHQSSISIFPYFDGSLGI